MKRSILWSLRAAEDYHRQLAFIAAQNPANAELVDKRIQATLRLLIEMPTGRAGRVSGTYEKIVAKTSLIVAYAIRGADKLEIVRIIHGARNWPPDEWPDD